MTRCGAFTRRARVAPLLCLSAAACAESAISPDPDPVEPERPVPCTFPNATCAERVEIATGLYLPLYSTHLLSEGHAGVTRGLIVIHGNNRNADTYFETGVLAVAEAGVSAATAIVAPHFQTDEDDPEADEPFWSSAGWKRGHLSRPEGPSPRVSSYAALDRIVDAFLNSSRFPAIREIVVAGHSAGGQVVHRYAATTAHKSTGSGIPIRYVVTNPSTFLYLGPERVDAEGGFTVPGTECGDYDDWHYGLQDRNSYAERLDADSIRAQLTRHDVRILLGDADTLTASLDVSCGANLQGPRRYHRGRTLVRFMDEMFSGHAHRQMIVPGVGHSSRSMWLSGVGEYHFYRAMNHRLVRET
ncbi:MAG: hypothetical protein F4022_13375, partial [Gemmatimonadetes bacterium]|nr:hypothetical protein [Gemmatimonadota bacterium]